MMALQGPVGQTVACPCNPGPPARASLVLQDREEPPGPARPGQTWCLLFPWIPLSYRPSFVLSPPSFPPHHHHQHHLPQTFPHISSAATSQRRTQRHPALLPPPADPPEHRMLRARLRRADKADALGNSARAPGPFFFSAGPIYSWP